MRNLLALIAVVGLISTAACKKDEKKADEPTTAEPKTDEVPTAVDPKPDSPEMANKMEHCPSSVEGAATKVEDGEGVVIVHVTAEDEAAVAEIRKRASHLAGLNDADSTEVKHSGSGTGGGVLGKCPVAVGASMVATVAAEDMEGGSKITLTPAKEDGLAELSKMVNDRVAGMAAGGAMHHGAGEGMGEHHGGDGKGNGGGTGGGTGGSGDDSGDEANED